MASVRERTSTRSPVSRAQRCRCALGSCGAPPSGDPAYYSRTSAPRFSYDQVNVRHRASCSRASAALPWVRAGLSELSIRKPASLQVDEVDGLRRRVDGHTVRDERRVPPRVCAEEIEPQHDIVEHALVDPRRIAELSIGEVGRRLHHGRPNKDVVRGRPDQRLADTRGNLGVAELRAAIPSTPFCFLRTCAGSMKTG